MTHTIFFHNQDSENFELIRNGTKTVETRAGSPEYNKITKGDTLFFVCGEEEFSKTVNDVLHFADLDALLNSINLQEIMPRVHSIQEAKEKWNSFPNYPERIKQFGIIAFKL